MKKNILAYLMLILIAGMCVSAVVFALTDQLGGKDSSGNYHWVVEDDGDLYSPADSDVGTASYPVDAVYTDEIVLNGSSITSVSQISTAMESMGTYVRMTGDDDIKLYANGNETITGDMTADSYTAENGAVLDNAVDNYVTLTENSDTLTVYFDGDDVKLDTTDGGIRVVLTDATDGTFDVYCNNVSTDGLVFSQGTNQSTITATGTGNDLYLVAAGGDINLADETITGTGALSIGAITCTSIAGVDTITGSTNSDVISLATDDILNFTSDNDKSIIEAMGFEAKDAAFRLNADQGDDVGDTWDMMVDDTDQNLEFWNETTELLNITTAGNIDMVAGTQVTLNNDETINASTDDTVQIASNDSSLILELYSPNTSNGNAEIIFKGDAGADAGDRWSIATDSANSDLLVKNDSAVAGTYVTKLNLDGATGDADLTGDLIVTGGNITIGAASAAADAGEIRLANATSILFEAAPAGTDITGLAVDSSEVVSIGSTGASAITLGAASVPVTITDDLTVSGGDVTISTATASKPAIGITSTVVGATSSITTYSHTRGGVDAVDGDDIHTDIYQSYDDGTPTTNDYVTTLYEVTDSAVGAEDGNMTVSVSSAGSSLNFLELDGVDGVQINSGAVDINTTIGSNDAADLVVVDAGNNDVALTRNLAAGATTDSAIFTVTQSSATADNGCASFVNAADASATDPTVTIQSSATGIVKSSLFINHDGTAGATTEAAVRVDSEDVNTAAMYITSPCTAAGTTSQIDDYVLAIVAEGVGGGISAYRNVSAATEALLNVREVHVDSTAPLANFNTAADASADDDAVTIASSSAAFDKRSLFINHDCTAGTTTVPAVEIDSEMTTAAAMIIRGPTTAAGTDAEEDDAVLAVVAEGVGGAGYFSRNVTSATEPIVSIVDAHADSTGPVALLSSAADNTADDVAVTISTTSATNDDGTLAVVNAGVGIGVFVDQNTTAGATTKAAVVIDSQDVKTAALYVMSPVDATGTTSQIDDYAVSIVAEGIGGGASIYRNVTGATEALLNIREVHADSTAPVVNINTAADDTADDTVVTIQSSSATLDKNMVDVINAGVGRAIFADQNITAGVTLVPAVEIDCETTNGAALIVRAPTTLTGTDADFDDYVMGISAEGVGGALHVHRDVDNPTGSLVKIEEDNVMTTSSAYLLEVTTDADASASTAAVQFTATSAANDQPVLSLTQPGTGTALTVVSGAVALNGDSITCDADLTITAAGLDLLVDSGLTVGSTTQAGDNNLRVEGTSALVGDVTLTGDININGDGINCDGDLLVTPAGADVLINGGLNVGDTTEPGDNNLIVNGTTQSMILKTDAKSTATEVITSADYGKTLFFTYAGAVAATLPANGATAGSWFRCINATSDTCAPTYSAATADTLITFNNATADSVTYGTGHRIGSSTLFISNGTYWIAINESGSNTMTVTDA